MEPAKVEVNSALTSLDLISIYPAVPDSSSPPTRLAPPLNDQSDGKQDEDNKRIQTVSTPLKTGQFHTFFK